MAGQQQLHATLAISEEEALNGAIRTLTLPGGQQVQVPVQPRLTAWAGVRLEGEAIRPAGRQRN